MEVFSGTGSEGQDVRSIDLRRAAVHTNSLAHEANQQPQSKPRAQQNKRHKRRSESNTNTKEDETTQNMQEPITRQGKTTE